MLFYSKTIRDRAISRKFWNLWVLETLDVVLLKKSQISGILAAILNFGGNQKCCLSQKPLEIERF